MRRLLFLVPLLGLGASLEGGCGSEGQTPLVGTWTFSGSTPELVTLALTFKADGTFTAVEQVAPVATPAGSAPAPGCATTDSYSGRYHVSSAGGGSTVTWSYDTGTVNAVLGCDDPSLDMAGSAATPDAIAAYTSENLLPPATEGFAQTQTTLVLTPGFGNSTSFTKSP
jgi:hypothetical protein